MTPLEQNLRGRAEQIGEAIRSGSIDRASRATLLKYSAWLCERNSTGPFGTATEHAQTSELVRLHLLRTFMDEVESRGARIQHIVIVLTVVAIIGTGFQTWYGYKADKRAEAELAPTAQQYTLRQLSASAPSRAQPPTVSQAASLVLPTKAASAAAQ